MVLCKNCGTVYDEFYGVCPRCGTTYQPEPNAAGTLPPLGNIGGSEQSNRPQSPLPSIESAMQTNGLNNGIPLQRPLDPEATIPVQRPIDPEATIPVQRPIDPEATIPVQRPLDPEATIPVQRPLDPEATIPVQRPIDPEATIPVQRPIDPEATIPVQRPLDPEATIPVQRPIASEPAAPLSRTQLQTPPPAPVNSISQTQEVPPLGNTNPVQYGDDYNMSPTSVVTPSRPPQKKGSAGKIIAIILIIAVILGGCGVGAYFLFFNKPQTSVSEQISQGDKYFAEKNYPAAIEVYKKAVEADPANADLYLKLAQAYIGNYQSSEAVTILEQGYAKTSSPAIKAKLDELSDHPAPSTDPESLRAGARSMNMAIINLYTGVTNGSVNADSPSNELRGLTPSRLPRAGASAGDKEAAAEALTVRDVVTYAQSSDRFNDVTIGYYVYMGAQVYYKDDASGFPLTFDTTIGQIMSAVPEQSSTPSVPESSVEESSVPEPSEPSASSEPSQPSEMPIDIDHTQEAALLDESCKNLYTQVVAGTLHKSLSSDQRHGIAAQKLPRASSSVSQKKTYANNLTIEDAVLYGGLKDRFDAENIGNYLYDEKNIYYRGDHSRGTPLTLDTTLGEIFDPEPEQSSNVSEPSQDSEPSQSSKPSKPESSVEDSSVPESSAEQSSTVESSDESSADVSNTHMAELAGKWAMTPNTQDYPPEEIKRYTDGTGYDEFVILLNANGYASAYVVKEGKTEILGTGEWSVDGTAVSVTIDGDTENFSYRNGHLYTAAWGDILYFARS